eukprot:12690955-Alexandrium_andersonii.AAC.1
MVTHKHGLAPVLFVGILELDGSILLRMYAGALYMALRVCGSTVLGFCTVDAPVFVASARFAY